MHEETVMDPEESSEYDADFVPDVCSKKNHGYSDSLNDGYLDSMC